VGKDVAPSVTAPEHKGLVERLRSRAWEHRQHRKYREEAAAEIERLSAALAEAEQLICALRGERQMREQALSRISALAQGNTQ
jgi:DNA-binding MarR family transcriptional regulator